MTATTTAAAATAPAATTARDLGTTSAPSHDGSAFTAARAVRAAASSAPPDAVNNDPMALNPEFRARLDRVITRMQNEYGHKVEIVEGYRTQSRQNQLYAQGRTEPGDIVTWTKSSKHTSGLAVDVKIDGSYDNPTAYQQLARVAQQEGLRTLGPRDPGHLELPSHDGASAWGAAPAATPSDATVSRAVEMALMQRGLSNDTSDDNTLGPNARDDGDRINALLGGSIRGSAMNSTIGMLRDGLGVSGVGQGNIQDNIQGITQGARFGASGYHRQASNLAASDDATRTVGQTTRSTTSAAAPSAIATPAPVATVAPVANVATVAHVAAVAVPGAPAQPVMHTTAPAPTHVMSGTLAADKVGQLLDARDNAPALPMSQLTVRLNDDQGGTEQIRLNLRGNTVDTHIALSNASDANRMSLRVGELQHALESRGIDADVVRVSATDAVAHAVNTASSTSQDTGAGWTPRHGQHAQGQESATDRERRPANHRESARQDADDPRQRARHEPRGATE